MKNTLKKTETQLRTISELATFIEKDWPEPSIKAKLYLQAMKKVPGACINSGVINIVKHFLKYADEYTNEEIKWELTTITKIS